MFESFITMHQLCILSWKFQFTFDEKRGSFSVIHTTLFFCI